MSEKTLPTLAAELWDFLGLGPDIDLPRLFRVQLERWQHDAGWRCTAHVDERDTPAAIEAVYAYAAYAEGAVRIQGPFKASLQPSGWQVSLIARITVAGVAIEVIANLDTDRYAAAMVGEVPDGWCCWESVRAQGPCADCAAGPRPAVDVHDPKPSVDLRALGTCREGRRAVWAG